MQPYLTPVRGELGLLLGRDTRPTLQKLVALLALRGPVRVLDASNRFNLHAITRDIVRLSDGSRQPLNTALNRIQIARAFTAYQIVTLLHDTRSTAETPTPCIVISLLTPFSDENLTSAEAFRLLTISITHLHRLRTYAPVIVSATPPPQPARAGLTARLRQAADKVFEGIK